MTSYVNYDQRAFATRSKRSALTIAEDHRDHVQSIETDATVAFGRRLRYIANGKPVVISQ
jgi:hypothetical protein